MQHLLQFVPRLIGAVVLLVMLVFSILPATAQEQPAQAEPPLHTETTVTGVVLATPPAGHFRLAGGIEREVWTDSACGLTRVTFPARDGSRITLERR